MLPSPSPEEPREASSKDHESVNCGGDSSQDLPDRGVEQVTVDTQVKLEEDPYEEVEHEPSDRLFRPSASLSDLRRWLEEGWLEQRLAQSDD